MENTIQKKTDELKDEGRDLKARAQNLAQTAEGRANEATTALGDSLENVGQKVSAKVEQGTQAAVEKLGTASRYLRDNDVRTMGGDLTDLVRRKPVASLCAGLGVGFFLGRLISR